MATTIRPTDDSSVSSALEPHRFSVTEYHQMIAAGILTEEHRVQLLDGVIVDMAPIGSRHATTVLLLDELLRRALPAGWHVRAQQPMTLLSSEPEPDLAVVRGSVRDFVAHHPMAENIAIVIEVGDTSIDVDRDVKIPLYASAGIPEYWLVDLVANRVAVFRDPHSGRYADEESFGLTQQMNLSLDGVPVAKLSVEDFLLPPATR